ncbi:MAG: N-acetylmuramoyl-L-alanine amidase family protein [Candidatus Eiseniibacteriota bacterium]
MKPACLAAPVRVGAVLALALVSAVAATTHVAERAPGPDSAPVHQLGDQPVIGANDLARLMDATRFWRDDVRKLELRARSHRVVLTADNPYVIVDQSTIRLPSPVRSLRGELQVPIALLDSLPADSALSRLVFDARAAVVMVVPVGGVVGTPRASVQAGMTRVVIPVDEPDECTVVSRARAHFRLRFGGYFTGVLSDSLRRGLLRGIRWLPSVSGTALEASIAGDAQGFRLERDAASRRVTLWITRGSGPAWEGFAPEGPAGPRDLRVVVLDPGHGGADAGASVGGLEEKRLTLALAKRLKVEIEHRLHAQVVLTHDADRTMGADERAMIANHAHADVVLSLHFDALPGSRLSGASAFCAPADARATSGVLGGVGTGAITLVPWRDVASRYAVASRSLAEALLTALELHGLGPTRLREHLATAEIGVGAPSLLLECATLTSERDRARLADTAALADLATAITDGLEAYQRNE